MAETYHIYDYKKLPARLVAIFCIGLKADSRVRLMISEYKIDDKTFLLADIADSLKLLWWAKTKDGQKGKNRPKSIVLSIIKPEVEEIQSYLSGKEFEKEKERILNGGGNGNRHR